MSLFGEYIAERRNISIVEDDDGFATYFFVNDSVYIEDIFVTAEARNSGKASRYADQIAEIAREKGCKKMYGSVVPSTKGSTNSLKVLLAYGFNLDSSANNMIFFVKEL